MLFEMWESSSQVIFLALSTVDCKFCAAGMWLFYFKMAPSDSSGSSPSFESSPWAQRKRALSLPLCIWSAPWSPKATAPDSWPWGAQPPCVPQWKRAKSLPSHSHCETLHLQTELLTELWLENSRKNTHKARTLTWQEVVSTLTVASDPDFSSHLSLYNGSLWILLSPPGFF